MSLAKAKVSSANEKAGVATSVPAAPSRGLAVSGPSAHAAVSKAGPRQRKLRTFTMVFNVTA